MSDLVAALAELSNPPTDSRADVRTEKGSFSYTYASLPAILNLVKPVLAKYGLALAQDVTAADGRVGVQTTILGEDGPALESGVLYLPAGNTPQMAGSAITYARRYQLTALLGIAADEDDDGASAVRGEVTAGQAGPGESHAQTESSPGPAPKYAVDATVCDHKRASGADAKFTDPEKVERCQKCGLPWIVVVEGTTADLGPAYG